MRSLFVGRWDPWPARSGAQLRSAMIVQALAELGPVDLVVLRGDGRAEPLQIPDGIDVDRVHATTRPERIVRRRRDLARWMFDSRLPPAVAAGDPTPVRDEVRGWAHGPYDLAWYERVETHALLAPVVDVPTIVDVDELRDVSRQRRLRDSWLEPGTPRITDRARRGFDHLVGHREAMAWRRLQRRSAQRAASAVVCSPDDADRLGTPNAAVVPNCVELPVVDRSRAPEPSVLFVGSMRYWPNADAATLLVRDVLPALRTRLPDVRLRLVGDAGPALRNRFDGRHGVELPGIVEAITPELATAGVVAVPLRYGSGTRLKIVEALAHGVPVVATSVAVEGLDVIDGEHLLIADSPSEFADRVVQVLTDAELATRLGRRGRARVEQRYAWPLGVEAVQRIATEVAGV